MLSFFKSPQREQRSPAEGETLDDVPADESVPVPKADGRASSVSIPTIDSAPTIQGPPAQAQSPAHPHFPPLPDSPLPSASLAPPSPPPVNGSPQSLHTQLSAQSDQLMQSQSQSALPYSPLGANSPGKVRRRFSFPSFPFLRSDARQNKLQTQAAASEKKFKATRALASLIVGSAASSEKRAKESALIVRSVIVGDHDTPQDLKSSKKRIVSKYDVARVKSQLLDPKTAAKVITHLRTLPLHPDDPATNLNHPIHAVCLGMPDKDVHEQYFAPLESVATASVSTLAAILADVHLIDLFTAPNMGFGAPVTAQGLFAGSVPTAETIIDGLEQITPQLMALGYATGRAILPDHKGVIVPTDRISVLTYWWGLEVCLPPPTIAHLEATESPGSALLNLLTALSVLNEGVREILPFVRYIAQFVQCEWSMIKREDEGKGVVCTATWLLPIALVPRAWDFADPPLPQSEVEAGDQSTPTSPSVKRFSATLATPKPSTEVANVAGVPRSSSAYSAETRDEEESRPAISSEPPVLPELVVSSPGSIDGAPPDNVDGEAHKAYEKVQRDGGAIKH